MRNYSFTGGQSQSFTPSVPPDEPYAVSHAWVGAVSDSGATVKFRSIDASAADLLISTSPTLTPNTNFTATEGNDDVWTAVVTGLSDDTQYYFGFDGNPLTGEFRTWAPEGDAFSFLITLGGDQGLNPSYPGVTGSLSNPPTYDRMLEHDPLFFIHMGDLHYRNSSTNNVTARRTNFKDVLSASRVNAFVRQVPTCYVWDDHDYGSNDSNGSSAGKPAIQQVYREYVPHWPLEEGAAIYHSFVCGRVRFINLDSRSGRTANSATDNSSKTRLGTTQKTWLKAELLAATEPLIVLNILSWWGDTTSFSDGWDSFSTERQELAEYFEDNNLTSRLLLVGADIHELAFDDGTLTQYDPGAVTPGPPYAQFAPIDASFNHFSAPYTRWQTRKQQYGTLDFVDSGTDITVTVKGWALSASPGATSSVQFTEVLVYPG